MGARVLLAEDDTKQAEVVRRYLLREGYDPLVVADGREAIEQARRNAPDLLILDVMMPRVDGLDVCRVLRQELNVPMLMLTALSTEDDMLLALDLGADDYVTKPYSPRELMARVRALLRRSGRQHSDPQAEHVLVVGHLSVDQRRHSIELDGKAIPCTPGEFALLATMAAEPGRVFSRSQLLRAVHGTDEYITQRTIDVHVMNLRRKIECDVRVPERLLTVFGVGYKLSAAPGDADRL